MMGSMLTSTWGLRMMYGYRAIKTFFSQGSIDPFPIRHAFRGYGKDKLRADLKAAVDVALVGIPQCMAFAAMAGLDSIYGIMAGAIGTFIAPLFSKCSLTVSGPSNATAFMLGSFFLAASPQIQSQPHLFVPIIILLSGLLCVFGAYIKATEMLQFVSRSVLIGYIAGAATLIVGSQLRYVLGLHDIGSSSNLFGMLGGIMSNLDGIEWQPTLMAVMTLLLFFIFKKYLKGLPSFSIILVVMSLLNWLLCQPWLGGSFTNVLMLRDFTMSDIAISVPAVGLIPSYLMELFPIVIAIAFLSMLEQTVMSKTISAKTGESVNLNQDAYSLGMANIISSVTTCLPSSASLTRSILNYNVGAKTRFAALYCGIIGLLIILLFANISLISAIPHPVLAALVLANAISLYDRRQLRICFRSTPGDASVLILTFISTLILPLHIAIFIGVVLSVSLFLRKAAKPDLSEYTLDGDGRFTKLNDVVERVPQISIVHVEGELFFGAADLFQKQVQRVAEDPSLAIVILRMRNARNLDATSVFALEELITFMREKNRHLLISGASLTVYRILRKSGILATLQEGCAKGESNIFLLESSNSNMSTRRALKRAQALLGSRNVDISIYTTTHQAGATP